jgi:hypothetical protein
MGVLDTHAISELFGTDAARITGETKALIENSDLSYREIVGEERDRLILGVLKRIDLDQQVIGADSRKDVWYNGWDNTHQDFLNSGGSIESLVPKFIRTGLPVRLRGEFVSPADPDFELRFVQVLRNWMFREFFGPFDNLYEFGCGTGFNLVALAKIFPEKRLFGSDFVNSSVDLVNAIAQKHQFRLSASLFDMTSPNPEYKILPSSAIFTFGSIEQLASRFGNFLEYLLSQRPGLCLHIEPTVELYDENRLIDYLAIKFHRKRGYTEGLLPALQKLAEAKRIELMRVRRLYFGSLMIEGYNLILWRPT